jgi:hypothetical protein
VVVVVPANAVAADLAETGAVVGSATTGDGACVPTVVDGTLGDFGTVDNTAT